MLCVFVRVCVRVCVCVCACVCVSGGRLRWLAQDLKDHMRKAGEVGFAEVSRDGEDDLPRRVSCKYLARASGVVCVRVRATAVGGERA